MRSFHDIKGFAFDLDGVLTDTARFHAQTWKKTAEEVGTKWTDELAAGLKGISRMDSLEMILKAGNCEHSYTHEQKAQLADEKNEYYKKLIDTLTPEDILPGMAEFLMEVKHKGYKLAVASASKNAPIILERLGIADMFDAVVDPAALKSGKPDPEIFVRAAELMNLQPCEVIGLEDSIAGIKSINGAGEVSVGIGDKDELYEAAIHFASTAEVSLSAIQGDPYFSRSNL
ncbi:beta-phosphoglucomutase [Heyndrickxia coagulans]|uniref:beta-phosphoglucomutase n=1 Tax=Heyndrickxia coagulans TaxID=1398 RepID=UPI002E220A86|nr:beta-phosphoglucomutase [Heyndrickxia coagulans]MED4964357.1 beta-phosphoglucomutase [Heyndrickxia coagulans]